MSYRIIVTRRAQKDIKKLDLVVRKKIKNKLELLKKAPLKSSRKLISARLGTYRMRIGNYRVIFDVEKETVVILRIGHRREIYR